MSKAEAAKHLPAAFTSQRINEREFRAAVTCTKCGRLEVGTDKPNCPPEVIAKHFTRRGWDIYRGGVQATCPSCQERRKRETEMSKDAIIAQAKCFKLLEEHCASDNRVSRYDKGWDDERVSRETGLSLDLVREARETLRPGRLADPVIEALEAEVAAERQRVAKELGEVRQLLENAEAEANRRLSDLERRVAEARRRPK